MVSFAVGCAALALWSAWNPGYYYLARAAALTLVGAGCSTLLVRDRRGGYALVAALLYAALVLGIAAAGEVIGFQAGEVESKANFYVPLAALAAAIATAVARTRQHPQQAIPAENARSTE